MKANDPDSFYTAAARNLALVEKAGLDLVTPCNGCYSTFKEARATSRRTGASATRSTSASPTEELHYDGVLARSCTSPSGSPIRWARA